MKSRLRFGEMKTKIRENYFKSSIKEGVLKGETQTGGFSPQITTGFPFKEKFGYIIFQHFIRKFGNKIQFPLPVFKQLLVCFLALFHTQEAL